LVGRVGPAFDTKKKYRLVASKSFLFAHIPACCVWDVSQNSYVTLASGKVPLIPGEFVDVVRAEFDWGGKPEVRIFVARQMDELIGILTVAGYETLLDVNNPTNIWLEEI
jgi:hypothetical protein